jgi:hypothetical protein
MIGHPRGRGKQTAVPLADESPVRSRWLAKQLPLSYAGEAEPVSMQIGRDWSGKWPDQPLVDLTHDGARPAWADLNCDN